MTSITKAIEKDFSLLSVIGKITFIESHGSSAGAQDIDTYIAEKYTGEAFKKELNDPRNIYHIIYHNEEPAGYSNIILNEPYPHSPVQNVTKLDRIYLMKEFYGLKLGIELLQFNIDLAKANNQSGIWLYTWTGNERAVNFYTKAGFKIIGSHDFKISETHSNPNHRMFLEF